MPNPLETPLHTPPQQAQALLPPVAFALAELESRLDRYVRRLRMSDVDRELTREAHDAIADARRRLEEVVARSKDVDDRPG